MTLIDYADSYCTTIGGSRGYREQLRVLCRRLPWQVHELDPERISEYLTHALRHLSPSTVQNHRRMLATLYRRAVRDGLAAKSTSEICRVKCPPKIIRAWTLEELRRLLDCAYEMPGGTVKNPCHYKTLLPAWILVGYSSGLRRGDMLEIRWDSLRGNRLQVVMSKTAQPHVCVLDDAALESMASLPRYDRLIFGSIITRDRIQRVMRRLINQAGLDGTGKWLRRSSATYAELSGMSATFQLGHLTPGLAYRHYVDKVILSELRKPVPSIPTAGVG